MLGVMFVAFLIQIVFRYLINLPVGWTHELSVALWIWLVLWGTAFVIRDNDEIRFDIIYGAVSASRRRIMCITGAVALVVLYALSLPAVADYVAFMRVEKTAYMKIRFDWLFSIYVIFVIATIIRQLWLAWRSLLGQSPERDPSKVESGL